MRALIALVAVTAMTAACANLAGIEDTEVEDEACTRMFLPVDLVNADFDDDGGWTVEPLSNSAICRSADVGVPAHSGDNAGCFGVTNLSNQRLFQTVTLPPETTQVRLRAQRCFVTTEPTDAPDNDVLHIDVVDPESATPLANLLSVSNRDAGEVCVWEPFEEVAPIPDGVGRIQLFLEGSLDDLEVTTFFLDTFQLEAFGCEEP